MSSMHDFDNDAMFGCDLRVCPPKPSPMSEHTATTNQQQHPITPPDELVKKIRSDALRGGNGQHSYELSLVNIAFAAGADQELKACCELLNKSPYGASLAVNGVIEQLRAARRPKAQSKAESALNALEHILRHSQTDHGANTIRLALERLKELEGQGNG